MYKLVPIIRFQIDDLIQLRKPHPCGGSVFRVMRVGSDIRILCQSCGRDMTMDRVKLEKATKQILTESKPKTQEKEPS